MPSTSASSSGDASGSSSRSRTPCRPYGGCRALTCRERQPASRGTAPVTSRALDPPNDEDDQAHDQDRDENFRHTNWSAYGSSMISPASPADLPVFCGIGISLDFGGAGICAESARGSGWGNAISSMPTLYHISWPHAAWASSSRTTDTPTAGPSSHRPGDRPERTLPASRRSRDP